MNNKTPTTKNFQPKAGDHPYKIRIITIVGSTTAVVLGIIAFMIHKLLGILYIALWFVAGHYVHKYIGEQE